MVQEYHQTCEELHRQTGSLTVRILCLRGPTQFGYLRKNVIEHINGCNCGLFGESFPKAEYFWVGIALMNVAKSSYNSSITGFATLSHLSCTSQRVSDGLANFNSGRLSTCCTNFEGLYYLRRVVKELL